MATQATQYVTVQGDTWDSIAFKVFGDEAYMKELIEANQDYVDIFIFEGGILIDLPTIGDDAANDALPFWRTQTDEEMDEEEEGSVDYSDEEDADEDDEDDGDYPEEEEGDE